MDRVLNFMGFEDEGSAAPEPQVQDDQATRESLDPRKKPTVVNLHAQRQVRVVVVEPKSFDEVQEVAEHLKGRRPVIVNLEHVDTEVARRIVDFVSGATFALNGNQQKVGGGIFLFVPSNVDIEGQVAAAQERGLFPWLK